MLNVSTRVYPVLHYECSRSRSRRGQHPLARKSLFIICHFEVVFLRKVFGHNFLLTPSISFTLSSPHPPAVNACGSRSEEHTSELQSRFDLVCRLLLEKKK